MQLKNKTIIVTGAAKGLGAAIAREVAASGAEVVCADLRRDDLQTVVGEIRASGGSAESVPCDVSRLDDLRNLVSEALGRYGKIDGLVNNAGVDFAAPFLEVSEADWDRVIDVDLKGAFFLTQWCARQMQQQGHGGSIVQIASVHTHASVAGASPYDAAKHGMVGFSKAAAVELAADAIRINILSPGLCRTEIWKAIVAAAPSEQACFDYWQANIPAGRLIEPDEIARCCLFLLSDESACITGANIMADHGMTSLLVSRAPYESPRR